MNALQQSSTTLEIGAKIHVSVFEDPCQSIGRGLNITHCRKKPKWRRGEQCWLAVGPAQAAFLEVQDEVARLLEDHCTEQPATKRFACTAYMIGLELEIASPVLTFVCKSVKFAEEASKIVEKSGLLKKLPGFSTALMDVLPTGDLVLLAYNNTQLQNSGSRVDTQPPSDFTSQTRGSDTFPRLPPRTDNWSFKSDYGLPKVFFDPRQEIRSTGMPLYIQGFNGASRKTTGNAFAFGTGYTYLTVAHHLMSAIPCDDESDGWDSGCEDSDADNAEVVTHKNYPEKHAKYASQHDDLLGHVVESSVAQDWALVRIQHPNIRGTLDAGRGPNEPILGPFSALPSCRTTRIKVYTSHGTVEGIVHSITPILSQTSKRSVLQKIHQFEADEVMRPGDSGSLVVDAITNKIYGQVIAASQSSRTTFFVSFKDTALLQAPIGLAGRRWGS